MPKFRAVEMRFTIEQRHLTDSSGKPVANLPGSLLFHTIEADSADNAVRLLIGRENAELMGDIMNFPGFQAVATMRKSAGVYTLQVGPTSQSRMPTSA